MTWGTSHDLFPFSERDEIELNLGWTCKKSTWCWPYLWIYNDFRKMSKFRPESPGQNSDQVLRQFWIRNRIPTVELKIPGKAFLKSESRTSEVRDSDFKNAFPRIFNFNVGILIRNSYSSAVDHERFTTGDWRTIKIQYTLSIRPFKYI